MRGKNNVSILQRIADNNGSFSPKQLKLAKFIEQNYLDLAYTTLAGLAKSVSVSETSVVRFVYRLGYKGFPEFMADLRFTIEQANSQGTSMDRFNIEHGKYHFPEDICLAIFTLEMQILQDTLAKIDLKQHQQAVDMLYSAPEIIVVGCGANRCLADALSFALQVIRPKVTAIKKLDLNEMALIRSASPDAVCVVFTTPRYPSVTQDITKLLKERGLKIIGVSESLLSPIIPLSDIFFLVPEKYVTFIDTNAAYMALIHSLVFALHFRDKQKSKMQINEYNEITRWLGYYVKGETELVDINLNDL